MLRLLRFLRESDPANFFDPLNSDGPVAVFLTELSNATANNIVIPNGTIYSFWVGVSVNPNGAIPSPLYCRISTCRM